MSVSTRHELDGQKIYEVREATQEEEQDFVDREETSFFSNRVEIDFSAITDCFSNCWGGNLEAQFEEDDIETNFIELAAKKWWNPKPFGESNHGDNEWVRTGHVVLGAGLSVLNSVAKVFFTVISFVPFSSSDFVKDIIDIDGWANEGFRANLSAQKILPSFFTALAVTVNPFAEMKRYPDKINCIGDSIFQDAVRNARVGMAFVEGRMQYTQENGIEELIERNVVSRFKFLSATVVLVVEKIIYLAIGVILTGCATLTLYRDEDLNNLARKYLGDLDVIDTICVGLRAVLYPWQNLGQDTDLSYYRDPYTA
ncbi:MAG: hypothetical protein H0T62_06105 [Parachlamydiaceae bacterium]|nr:hypothetical protein [Parachlamydiaceae bacterium]